MEDDDLAHNAQQLLDVLEDFLGNAKLTASLSGTDLDRLRKHREKIKELLAGYRILHYMKPRRAKQVRKIPSGALQDRLVPVALAGAATLAPTLIGAGTATGAVSAARVATVVGPALALGEIVLPFAVAVLIDQLLGGGSPRQEIARKLLDAVKTLSRDILEMDALTKILAITAVEAAGMATDALLGELIKALNAGVLSALAVILEELLRRFPGCAEAIEGVSSLARQIHRIKTNPGHFGPMPARCSERKALN